MPTLSATMLPRLSIFLRGQSLALLATLGLVPPPMRHERDVAAALGEPMLAAHPSGAAGVRALARQLATYWFTGGRRLLPIVDVGSKEGAGPLAWRLAEALTGLGRRTLLVDADLRSPALDGALAGPGLADYLEGRQIRFHATAEKLVLLGAGRGREHPLELLSRERLPRLLHAAARRFGAVLVCPPPVACGPDFEIFAALAGGALVLAGRSAGPTELAVLRRRLERCAARAVGTVLERG